MVLQARGRRLSLIVAALAGMMVGACASADASEIVQAAPIYRPLSDAAPSSTRVPDLIAPSQRSQAAAPQRSVTRTHTVASGENLFRIALNNGMTTQELAALNGLSAPYTIVPGQELRLAATTMAAVEQPAAAPAAPPPAATRSVRTTDQGEPLGGAPTFLGERGVPEFALPVEGRVVARTRSLPDGSSAPGWTISVPPRARVAAAAAGSVMYVGDGVPGFGNLVLIRHNDAWVTAYGHNEEILISRGDRVSAGQTIARAQRPRRSESTEVYFEIRNGVTPVDPGQLIPSGGLASRSIGR
ncbi:peptidoglycan DD-metalloendopeptidase family protein [Maricaulaceae bacterium MS644]